MRGPGVTLEQARAAISAVAPALEIVETRGAIAGDLGLALADNAQQKAFVTGTAIAPPTGFHLSDATVEVLVNGQSMERASGAEVMGDPAASIAWLANKLAEFDRSLEAGMVVMSGSFTRQYAIAAGGPASKRASIRSARSARSSADTDSAQAWRSSWGRQGACHPELAEQSEGSRGVTMRSFSRLRLTSG